MVALHLLILHIHKIGIKAVVNKIALHTENELYSLGLCRCIRFGQRLNYAVVRNGERSVPPLCRAFNELFGSGNSVHFRDRRMKVKLNALFLGVILLFRLHNGFNIFRAQNELVRILVKLICTVYYNGCSLRYLADNRVKQSAPVKHTAGYGRGIIGNIKGKRLTVAALCIL